MSVEDFFNEVLDITEMSLFLPLLDAGFDLYYRNDGGDDYVTLTAFDLGEVRIEADRDEDLYRVRVRDVGESKWRLVSSRATQCSLGAICHFALTGRLP